MKETEKEPALFLQRHGLCVAAVLRISEAQLELHCQEVVGYYQCSDVRGKRGVW